MRKQAGGEQQGRRALRQQGHWRGDRRGGKLNSLGAASAPPWMQPVLVLPPNTPRRGVEQGLLFVAAGGRPASGRSLAAGAATMLAISGY